MAKILVVDDDIPLSETIGLTLSRNQHTVDVLNSGDTAEEYLRTRDADVLVLDWDLPHCSGIQLAHQYRARGGVGRIIFLTGKSEMEDKALGFDSGADDYLTKPFNVRELVMRVEALLRRASNLENTLIKAGPLTLHPNKSLVFHGKTAICLSRTEYQVLELFMTNVNKAFTQDQILARAWSVQSEASEDAVKTTIHRLRHKVDPTQTLIKTIRGRGYLLEV